MLDHWSRRRRLALIFLIWTVQGLLWVGQAHITNRLDDRSVPLWQVAAMQMGSAWSWALATLVILRLGRRYRFDKGSWPRSLAVHVAASLVIVFCLNLVFIGIGLAVGRMEGTTPVSTRLLRMFVGWFDFNALIYWVILGLGLATEHLRRERQRELRASQLETQLARARLENLEMQLHPHFLFNALHTVAALVRTNQNPLAIRVVATLGDLLRQALDRGGAAEVALKEELEFLGRYLEIEQIRFGDRLQVVMEVEPETLDARVPYLILQPLVENAIRHGIAPRASAGRLVIAARLGDGRLRLRVRDDGPGLPEGFDLERVEGVGLSNTRERLEQMHGAKQTFAVRDAEGGGVEVSLTLPFSRVAVAWHVQR